MNVPRELTWWRWGSFVRCWLGFHEMRGMSLPGGSTVVFRCRHCGAS